MPQFILVTIVTRNGVTYARHYEIDVNMHFGFAIDDLLRIVENEGDEVSSVHAELKDTDK